MNPIRRGVQRLKAMVFRKTSARIFNLRRSTYDWEAAVGDGTSSSTVMAPLLWIVRTFPEAPPGLWKQLDTGQEEQIRDHPLLRLLQRPNPHFTGPLLWMATMMDWSVDGNAYWLKIRDRIGNVVELWWVPSWMIRPQSDPEDTSVFISFYEYKPDYGEPIRIDPTDIVHFRFGADADDQRKGYSPLKSVLREVFTDDEAAIYTASLLRNMGVPGLVISPEAGVQMTDADADATKGYIKARFGGDNRGDPMVMTGATKIAQFGLSPDQMLLRDLRRIPEERVSAVLGVPAIVAGLGAGLERSTFTNMGEAREMAYESTIIPTQRIVAEDIRFQLYDPDFTATADAIWSTRFGFDLTKVRVLQEDLTRQAARLDQGVRGGWIRVDEARRHMGFDTSDRDRIYLRLAHTTQVPADGGEPQSLAPAGLAPAPATTGSNGHNGALASHVAQEVIHELEAAERRKG